MMRKADVSFEELYNCYKVRFERFAISYIQDRSVAEDRSENLKVVLCRRISGRWSFVIPSIFLLERLRLSFGKVWKNYRN